MPPVTRRHRRREYDSRGAGAPPGRPAVGAADREERTRRSRDPLRPGAPRETGWRGAVAIAAAALFLALLFHAVVWEVGRALALLFAATVVAQALAPVVDRLERRLPRVAAVIAVYVALLLGAAGLGWFLVPRLIDQANQLMDEQASMGGRLRTVVATWSPTSVEQVASVAESGLSRFGMFLVELPLTLLAYATDLVLVFFLSLYWLVAQPRLNGFVLRLLPVGDRDRVGAIMTEVGQVVGGYVRGVVIDALIVGALTYAGLTLLGLRFAVVLAIVAGIGELVPVVGPILAAVPALGLALLDSSGTFLTVLGFYVVLQQVESNVIVPLVMRGQAHIPPLLSLTAFLIGSALGGIVAAVVAIPLFGVLLVLANEVVVPTVRGWTGAAHEDAGGEDDRGPRGAGRGGHRRGVDPPPRGEHRPRRRMHGVVRFRR